MSPINRSLTTAIIVTDRVVLDRQLQSTVSQFEQTTGVVKKIDGTSRQLKEAINAGARIIVTTIQKFSTDHLKEISGQGTRKFAVIVDEAHGSQSGKSAQAMTDALTRDLTTSDDIEDMIAEYQKPARATAKHQLLRIYRYAPECDFGKIRDQRTRWFAASVPSLFNAASDRGAVHPGRAPELHDI